MHQYKACFGIDIAADTFTACAFFPEERRATPVETFPNNPKGFRKFLTFVTRHARNIPRSFCMENTGVYGLALALFLNKESEAVFVEPAQHVRKAQKEGQGKSDALDSRMIAEYAFRYEDRLTPFVPPPESVLRVKSLLRARENCVKERTAAKNALAALKRHPVKMPFLDALHRERVQQANKQVAAVEKEIRRLLNEDKGIREKVRLVKTVPGVGPLLAAHAFVLSRGFQVVLPYRTLLSYLGMCPLEHQSGTSIRKRSKGRGYGPRAVRKLIGLAAMRLCATDPRHKAYWELKKRCGKSGRVILNNIGAKMLKIMLAVLQSGKVYDPGHVSRHPHPQFQAVTA